MLRPLLIALAAAALIGSPAPAQPAPPPAGAAPMPSPLRPGDAFGQEVTLPARTIVYVKGSGTWDKALDTIGAAVSRMSTTTISLPMPFILTNL